MAAQPKRYEVYGVWATAQEFADVLGVTVAVVHRFAGSLQKMMASKGIADKETLLERMHTDDKPLTDDEAADKILEILNGKEDAPEVEELSEEEFVAVKPKPEPKPARTASRERRALGVMNDLIDSMSADYSDIGFTDEVIERIEGLKASLEVERTERFSKYIDWKTVAELMT